MDMVPQEMATSRDSVDLSTLDLFAHAGAVGVLHRVQVAWVGIDALEGRWTNSSTTQARKHRSTSLPVHSVV